MRFLLGAGSGWTLRARLVGLAFLCAVPALGLAVADTELARREARAQARERASGALARLADAHLREMRAGGVLLEALARHPAVTAGSADACRAALAPLLGGVTPFDGILRRTAAGTVTCSARAPAGAASGSAGTTLEITHRIPGGGAGSPVLVARVRHDWLLSATPGLALPTGSKVVAFSASGERLLSGEGAPRGLPDPISDALRERRHGAHAVLDADGALWAAATVGAPLTPPVRVAVMIPSEAAYALSRRLFAREVAFVVLGALAIAAIASLGAERLLRRPIQALAEVARRFSEGDLTVRASGTSLVPELGTFALAFNQMAEAVEERSRQLAVLAERAPDGIVRIAPDGVVLYANPAMTALVGGLPGTLSGQTLGAALPAPLAAALAELCGTAAQRRDAVEREVAIGTGDDRRTLEVRVVPEQEADGTPPVVLAVVRDVSEARRTTEALWQAQKLDSIGRLAGGIAHDFNNLLTGIVGHADLALESLPDGHPARVDLLALRDAAMRSTGMTRELLTFARQQAPSLQALDVGTLLGRVRGLLGRVVGDDVRLDVEPAQGLPAVAADASHLEQVLVNLAVNARDAMPRGGSLMIRARVTEVDAGDAARFGLRAPGTHVAIEVADTGSGMPQDVLARIFDPFFTTKPPGEGTGLGLATSYGIAKQHGGALAVASTLGVGTRFTLYLPSSSAVAREIADDQDAWRTTPGGGQESVLLAEDDDALRPVLARALRMRGYTVHEAEDGAAALALATGPSAPPLALVITDMRMPRLSGDGLARQLRRARPGLPVLFITGNAAAGRSVDGAPVLAKPFTSVQLLHAIRGLLDHAPVH